MLLFVDKKKLNHRIFNWFNILDLDNDLAVFVNWTAQNGDRFWAVRSHVVIEQERTKVVMNVRIVAVETNENKSLILTDDFFDPVQFQNNILIQFTGSRSQWISNAMEVWLELAFGRTSVIAIRVVVVAFAYKNESIATNLFAAWVNSIKTFFALAFFVLIQDKMIAHVTKCAINNIGWAFVRCDTVRVINANFCNVKEGCLTRGAFIIWTNIVRIETSSACWLVWTLAAMDHEFLASVASSIFQSVTGITKRARWVGGTPAAVWK